MEINYEQYLISDNIELLQLDKVTELLRSTYWAKNRSDDTIVKSIENSINVGVYFNGLQIGFARCVTDYFTVYWLCDVIIDEKYRKKGIGHALVEFITEHKKLKPLMGILSTKHSKELYAGYGFRLSTNGFMIKSRGVKDIGSAGKGS